MPDHIERDLSSICVRVPARRYGSRTSTVILVRNNGSFNNGAAPAQPRLRIVERNYEMSADVDGMFHLVDERDELF